jgi:hypothetical protein
VDIQNAVLAKGRLDSSADRVKVKDWINQAAADAVLRTECLIGIATVAPVAGCTSQTLGSAAMRIKGIFPSYGGQNYRPLQPVSLETILERRMGSPGQYNVPSVYAAVGMHGLEFWPTVQAGTSLLIYYVKAPTVLVADADVSELPEPFASKLLEYGALVEAADFKRDDQLQIYTQRYLEWVGKLQTHVNRYAGGVAQQLQVYGTPVFPPHDPSTDSRW